MSQSYVVRQVADGHYKVEKYNEDQLALSYEVRGGKCTCPGFKIKQRKGDVCKHVQMVVKFDPSSIQSMADEMSGVRDEAAQAIYERVADGLGPFVDSITLKSLKRHTVTSRVVGLLVHATPHKNSEDVVAKLTSFIDGISVEVLIE